MSRSDTALRVTLITALEALFTATGHPTPAIRAYALFMERLTTGSLVFGADEDACLQAAVYVLLRDIPRGY